MEPLQAPCPGQPLWAQPAHRSRGRRLGLGLGLMCVTVFVPIEVPLPIQSTLSLFLGPHASQRHQRRELLEYIFSKTPAFPIT